MENRNIAVMRYRTYGYYPYHVFEVEIEVNGKIIYANMDVLHKGKMSVTEIKESDLYWFYDLPLTEIEDIDDHYVDLVETDIDMILESMVYVWNSELTIIDDETWRMV